MNETTKRFVATAQTCQTKPPELSALCDKLKSPDAMSSRSAIDEKQDLMKKLLRLKLNVPDSASTEQEQAMADERMKDVVKRLQELDKNKKKDGLFDVLADLKPVSWGFNDYSRKFKWEVNDDLISIWLLAFLGIVHDWGVDPSDIEFLVGYRSLQNPIRGDKELLLEHLDEAYATWARMKLVGLDLFDVAS